MSADAYEDEKQNFEIAIMTVQLEKLRAELEQGREQAERAREAFKHDLEKDLEKAEQERERFKLELPKIAAETRRLERETRDYPWLQSLPAALSPPLSPPSWRIRVDVVRRVFAH